MVTKFSAQLTSVYYGIIAPAWQAAAMADGRTRHGSCYMGGYSGGKVTAMTELVMTTLYDSTRTMLQREREVVTRRMANIERDARDLELDTDGIPSTGYEREQALSQMLVSRLVDIDNALSRLELGTYGVCAGCANQIPPRRLEALPFATLCVGCQSAVDKRLKKRV